MIVHVRVHETSSGYLHMKVLVGILPRSLAVIQVVTWALVRPWTTKPVVKQGLWGFVGVRQCGRRLGRAWRMSWRVNWMAQPPSRPRCCWLTARASTSLSLEVKGHACLSKWSQLFWWHLFL